MLLESESIEMLVDLVAMAHTQKFVSALSILQQHLKATEGTMLLKNVSQTSADKVRVHFFCFCFGSPSFVCSCFVFVFERSPHSLLSPFLAFSSAGTAPRGVDEARRPAARRGR